METERINLLELSDSKKGTVLRQARAYLQRQLAEASLCSKFVAENSEITAESSLALT